MIIDRKSYIIGIVTFEGNSAMNKILFSFIKRFIIAPLIIVVAVISAVAVVMPKLVDASQIQTVAVAPEVDISNYQLLEYDSFSELKNGDYVATISSDEISLCSAVFYVSSNDVNAVHMLKASKEPWNGGSVAIIGDNNVNEFKNLHNCKQGTKLEIDYYKNARCSYEIVDVVYNNTKKDIKSLMNRADLVLCVEYNDFETPDESDAFYIAYLAKMGGMEKWQ